MKIWRCPNCETINNINKCVVCGKERFEENKQSDLSDKSDNHSRMTETKTREQNTVVENLTRFGIAIAAVLAIILLTEIAYLFLVN